MKLNVPFFVIFYVFQISDCDSMGRCDESNQRKNGPCLSQCYSGLNTGIPRYLRTFYMRIRLFTLSKMIQNHTFPVKNGLFICKFKIIGPKWRNVFTTNNEGSLHNISLKKNLNYASKPWKRKSNSVKVIVDNKTIDIGLSICK
jgi:hypothetical protein